MIRTKLNRPMAGPQTILRHRAMASLDQGMKRRLLLMVAGAGYGKSTAASAWMEQKLEMGSRVVWLSLEVDDNDPHRFMRYLTTALAANLKGLETVIDSLQSGDLVQLEWVLDECVFAIEQGTEDQMLILALDDYHLIQDQAVHGALDYLIRHSPETFKILMMSRQRPDLPLALYRSRGWLHELDEALLAFDVHESELFLRGMVELENGSSTDGALMTLIKRTEGWVAGLQLAALTLKPKERVHSKDSGDQPSQEDSLILAINAFTGSHPFVVAYLTEQVLASMSRRERLILLCAAVTDRFCTELVAALLKPLGEVIDTNDLSGFESKHYFVISLDEGRRWFRFHHLFLDVLRSQLDKSLGKGGVEYGDLTVEKLHMEASRWFAENDCEIEAFQHATAAGDIDRAAMLLQVGQVPLVFRGATRLALNWLESLPLKALDTRPWLWVLMASADFYLGRIGQVARRLQAAEKGIELLSGKIEIDFDPLKGHIASVKAILYAVLHDSDKAEEEAQLALRLTENDNVGVKSSAFWALGYAKLLKHEHSLAEEYLGEAKWLSQKTGPVNIWLMASNGLGKIKQEALSYEAALRYYQEIFEFKGHKAYPTTADAYLGKAQILMKQDRLSEAEELIREASRLVGLIDRTDRKMLCQMEEVKLMAARGAFREALIKLEGIEKACKQEGYSHLLEDIAYEQGRILLKLGNIAAVDLMLKLRYMEKLDFRLKLAKGEARQAIELIEPRIEQGIALGMHEQILEDLILHAHACYRHGARHKGFESLQRAVALCHQNNCTRPFAEAGMGMIDMIRESELELIYPAFITRILMTLEAKERPEIQEGIESLTPRELDVLRLIADGMSNEEIGNQLYLVLSSVKGINQRIFGKMQVDRRTEAVAKGKQLGWIT